jgi:hypothetical protein
MGKGNNLVLILYLSQFLSKYNFVWLLVVASDELPLCNILTCTAIKPYITVLVPKLTVYVSLFI